MNYSKQLKKQKRKQLKLANAQQQLKSGSAYGSNKGSSSKGLVGFIILCGFIANTMSANAEAATHVYSHLHSHINSFEAQNQTITMVTGPNQNVRL
ncbi:MAG: hypothetical protein HRT35_38730 [Algicola sp.]|nr:hypothetical protein [Algicola sp.]